MYGDVCLCMAVVVVVCVRARLGWRVLVHGGVYYVWYASGQLTSPAELAVTAMTAHGKKEAVFDS